MILLDARVLVVDVQRWLHALGDHPRAKAGWRALVDAPVEDQLHLVRPPQIQVVTDHTLEERTSVQRTVEHLGEGELGLQDRHLVEQAGKPVGTAERVRQPLQPLAQQRLDAPRSKAVCQFLHALRVGATENAVVECLEGDARACQLPLQVLMAVEAQLGVAESRNRT